MESQSNILNSDSQKHIYVFLNSLKMKNNRLNNSINYLFSLTKLQLKDIIMFKYYINHIIVCGNKDELEKIYNKLLELLQNNQNKDYIFALLYYIIIEQKSLMKNNKKAIFNKNVINNLFKNYTTSENKSNNLSISRTPSNYPPPVPSL